MYLIAVFRGVMDVHCHINVIIISPLFKLTMVKKWLLVMCSELRQQRRQCAQSSVFLWVLSILNDFERAEIDLSAIRNLALVF